MYSAATHELAQAFALDFLEAPTHVFLYAAIIAWAGAFFGLVRRLLRYALRHGPAHPA
jgi:hypothetical protein